MNPLEQLAYLHPHRVHLAWIAVAFVALLAWFDARGSETLSRFVSPAMQARLTTRAGRGRRAARLLLVLAMALFGVVALMRPRTPARTETVTAARETADIMVVLDVSRSMLADDARPTRLARAKAEVLDMLGKLGGQRVGLVAFAGRAAVLCPLTPNHDFFRMVLRGVDTRSVARGGTRIGDALRKAVGAFGPGPGAKLALLITDGEDHDSYPRDAAKEALEAGVRVVAIGFGSEEGSPITLVDPDTGAKSTLTDRDGRQVVSRLDGKLLREVALATEGAYVPAGVAALDLESIVRAHIQPLVHARKATSVRVVQGEQYAWFVLGALVSLLGAVAVGSTPGRRDPW